MTPDNEPPDMNSAPRSLHKDFDRAAQWAVAGNTLGMAALGVVMGPIGWAMLTYTGLAAEFFTYVAFGDNWFSDLIGPDDLSISRAEMTISAAVGAVFGAAAGLDKGWKASEAIRQAKDQARNQGMPAPRP